MKLLPNDPTVKWMSLNKWYVMISGVMLVISIVAIAARGINFGIDFAGGYELQVKFDKHEEEEKVQKLVEGLNLGESRVQRYGAETSNEFLILVRQHSALTEEQRAQMKGDLEQLAGGPEGLSNFSVAESGENVIAGFTKQVDESAVRGVITKYGLNVKNIRAGERTDRSEYVIDLVGISDKVQEALKQGLSLAPDAQIIQKVEFVGPQVGSQLRNQGVLAVVYAMIFILFYIALRFDFYFAPGAIGTLIHDLIITVGVFALFQIEFNLPIVAAILTLVGFSLNDTIVIFDRIRENMVRMRGASLLDLVDASINQTLARTLITSGAMLVVVVSILVVGGSTTRDFALCMTIGIVLGSYSTIAISCPAYVVLRQRAMASKATAKDRPLVKDRQPSANA